MPPGLAALFDRLNEMSAALGTRARLALGAGAAVALVVGLAVWVTTTVLVDYQLLFSNLTQEDAAAVVEALRAGRVPYRVAEGGQVLVPAAHVHEWRLKLASQGVPSGGGVGFEIFDKNQFGLTEFAQRLNFQRALQGELARTIGQLREVQQARVHLALPTPRVFSSQERPATASVVLRLRPGAALRLDQVRGIVHLVTSSVEGLTPDRVTVVDASGRMLAPGLDRAGGLNGNQRESRTGVEQDIERRIQTLLDPIVGPGHSAVRVAAHVSFDQVERTEERFDPKTLVRQQTRASEQHQGAWTPPTVAPATGKTPPRGVTQHESEQTTYEIARTVERTVVAPGDVKRLSIAVLLDVPLVNGVRTPRPDEEIERIRRLVGSAAGTRADRQDELEVVQVPFDPGATAPGEAAPPGRQGLPPSRVPPSPWSWALAVGFALVAMMMVMMRRRRRRRALADAVGAAFDGRNRLSPGAPAAPPPTSDAFTTGAESPLAREVARAAREHPDQMAQLLRAWMVRGKTMVG